jgi:hypothetical protein
MMHQEEVSLNFKTIYTAQGMLRAMTIRGCLEGASIPVALEYENPQTVEGLSPEGKGRVRVMVPAEWEDEARALLSANPRTGEIFCVPDE